MGAQYYDAKWVKKAITRLVLVETLGGIAPPTKQFLHVFAKEAAGTNTDRTVYGAASASACPPSSSTTRSRSPWRRWLATPTTSTMNNKQTRKMRTNWVNSPELGCPQGPKKERKKEMGHPRSQHFVLESRDIESVTRRVGRWGFSKVYPWNGRIQP